MSIAILPARLANQIAAGEVVERPASVIKELIENSLDAGATNIHIEVVKGGIKKIRISDNGSGIVKDELTLALSRHATSKIKDLNDLEAINSLGFRGEALASISSVARLTLTSKPKEQVNAWQANAEGRDMAVTVKPAAHPDGTSIEVLDLFFNTPARRKFLRTEKTEFHHIDEVVRRIALARFDVGFTLTHNGKTVRQYRIASTKAQQAKRVAMVCGQKFIENAIEVECQHDDMTFSGWLAKPSFSRSQNDLCYSYVNGRMMRDKLINHAIRQAYSDLLPHDAYPAFVLFLTLNHKDVDVNVHPAKHEVRFHQSRYVHDFIYSVCHQGLQNELSLTDDDSACGFAENQPVVENHYAQYPATSNAKSNEANELINLHHQDSVNHQQAGYIGSLSPSSISPNNQANLAYNGANNNSFSSAAVSNYQRLMETPITTQPNESIDVSNAEQIESNASDSNQTSFFLHVAENRFAVFKEKEGLRLLSLTNFAESIYFEQIKQNWQKVPEGLISQPLLLPVMLQIDDEQKNVITSQKEWLNLSGIHFTEQANNRIQIRQFPAVLRDRDISNSFLCIINELLNSEHYKNNNLLTEKDCCSSIAKALILEQYQLQDAENLLILGKNLLNVQLNSILLLNSVEVDLTSSIKQLQ
ncbi:DNA mismatch repair endonuclease MutL [Litorilituus lipolyticus]|uniref:DNA mismatch repair protein MutL n=1 Tax=Litorilituus lipolyticus TaxID=2491017 RepID=A0A502KVE7_9GAMM|nr:DNA mismatch repair endonuclease MutL [Litorilituus lipolyticus]TPH15542.1 DNA mismatch repair endonuclease MutL [Litorilituus lipolyticus]